MRADGKLRLTSGVSTVKGSSGGGLATWSLIACNDTVDGIGGSVHATYVLLSDYSLTGARWVAGCCRYAVLGAVQRRIGDFGAGGRSADRKAIARRPVVRLRRRIRFPTTIAALHPTLGSLCIAVAIPIHVEGAHTTLAMSPL